MKQWLGTRAIVQQCESVPQLEDAYYSQSTSELLAYIVLW